MLLASTVQLFALAAMGAEAGPGSSIGPNAMPEPIATRQTLFAIPFRIEPADQASPEPVEVQLWVSGDRGGHWQLYSRVEPARQHFLFRAGGDGEFWFQVRTLDRSGRLRPAESEVPGLRVVVDTVKPKLQLQAQRGQAGQITAQWQVSELNAKPDSLKIQYRTATDGPLQPVAVGRENHRFAGSIQTGEVTWWPQSGSGVAQVRAEVTDTAGNTAVSHAQVDLNPQQASQPAVRTDPAPGDGSRPPLTAVAPPPPWRPGTTDTPSAPRQDDRSMDDPFARNQRFYGDGAADDPPGSSVTSNVNPKIQDRYVPQQEQTGSSAKGGPFGGTSTWPADGMPPGQRPRMVNARIFPLEYDVESVGPSGIARVELFGTRDGGRTWQRFAVDDDNRSPLSVQVDEEGMYGFRIVVQNGAGLGGRLPQNGDLPEVVIGVDLTKPDARITATEQGTGTLPSVGYGRWPTDGRGQLIISWQADDEMLAARPVSLSFSENPGGPWTTIASGLENSGRYAWPLDGRAPGRIYLRLEVRDEAGNIGVFETPDSVVLDRAGPSARIRGIQRPGQSYGRTPTHPYYQR